MRQRRFGVRIATTVRLVSFVITFVSFVKWSHLLVNALARADLPRDIAQQWRGHVAGYRSRMEGLPRVSLPLEIMAERCCPVMGWLGVGWPTMGLVPTFVGLLGGLAWGSGR